MPTTWNRSPENFHRSYIANTDAFYHENGNKLAPKTDEFITKCALGLWSKARAVTQDHVDMANQIYSRNRTKPSWMLWTLTSEVCNSEAFLPPQFFWELAETDARNGTDKSRTFIRMLTNILLFLAAADDDVTFAEAEYITECVDKLTAICDTNGVKKSREPINPLDYVTSQDPSFIEKHPAPRNSAGGSQTPEKPGTPGGEKPAEKPDFDKLMAELEELVGLDDIKKDIKSLINLVKIRKLREANGLPIAPMSLHMVFLGNPGTGKTTVARLVSGLYAAIGVLSKGQLIEVDRSGLVAGYVGQTALKTQEVIKSALGGVLFIDEAYSLSSGGENDFGREAIETILKAMEDHRDDLVVIVAGYTGPMTNFINSNPGLQSRFNKYFYFEDYTGEQLMAIFRIRCEKNGYRLSDEADKAAAAMFDRLYAERDENFGNGRDVRNLFEDAVTRQANRLAKLDAPSKDELMTLLPADLEDSEESEESRESEETETDAGEAAPEAVDRD